MTDEEILEKYRETIESEVNEICKKNHIEVNSSKLGIFLAYQEKFLEGLKKEAWENAKRMIKKGQPLEEICDMMELNIEIVKELSAKVAKNQRG